MTSSTTVSCAGTNLESTAENQPNPGNTVQLIVKFRDPSFNPDRSSYLRQLSAVTGGSVVYIRPFAGDAHILRFRDLPDAKRALELLKSRPEIERVEVDRLMHPMRR